MNTVSLKMQYIQTFTGNGIFFRFPNPRHIIFDLFSTVRKKIQRKRIGIQKKRVMGGSRRSLSRALREQSIFLIRDFR